MTSTVQFNHQISAKTVKVCNIVINTFLSLKPYRVVFQKAIL